MGRMSDYMLKRVAGKYSSKMYEKARKWNKKNIDNYVEIYIKSDLSKILKLKKKRSNFPQKIISKSFC